MKLCIPLCLREAQAFKNGENIQILMIGERILRMESEDDTRNVSDSYPAFFLPIATTSNKIF